MFVKRINEFTSFILKNKYKLILGSIVLVGLFVIFNSISFAANVPVKSVSIKSSTLNYDNNDEGSFNIEYSSKWLSRWKVLVTFDVDSNASYDNRGKDLIIVCDTSASMSSEKFSVLKDSVVNVVDEVLSNTNNRVALINFSTNATILSGFSNDKENLDNLINSFVSDGGTNYYKALLKVDELLKNYSFSNDRKTEVLFITDGYPELDVPNEVGQYKYLKDSYPDLLINGVQYGMGDKVVEKVENISDRSFCATDLNISSVLNDIILGSLEYDKFNLSEVINDKYFDYVSSDSTVGNITVKNNILNWDVDNFKSGTKVKLTMELELKDEYKNEEGLYEVSNSTNVEYSINGKSENVSTSKTPILSTMYTVTYEGNAPSTCNVTVPVATKYLVFDSVKISSSTPSCLGYQFQGWEIINTDVERKGDNFVIPENDVVVRAVWTKLGLNKSMDGKLYDKVTLYKQVKNDYLNNDGAEIYTGSRETMNGNKEIYYYVGSNPSNHVLFGGFCWRIVRTTDTGGVKLIYDGVPDDENKCNNMGDDVLIGTSKYNPYNYSIPMVGYMYNVQYKSFNKSFGSSFYVYVGRYFADDTYYFGDSITYENGKYILKNSDGSEVGTKNWESEYSNLTGYYACLSSPTCSKVYYIVHPGSSYSNTLALENGDVADSLVMNLATDVVDNGDATFTLKDPIEIKKKDWYTDYEKYAGYYICEDLVSTTCSSMMYIGTAKNSYFFANSLANDYVYGNSFTWDGEKYTLTDTIHFWNSSANYLKLSNYHYGCFSTSNSCSKIYFIYTANSSFCYYLEFADGKSITDALDEMLSADDVNTNDSLVKTTVDTWYENNLINYGEYLEDTVWCNNRKIGELGKFDINGDVVKDKDLIYDGYINSKLLECPNLIDRFTVSSDNGNGSLKYPVGLITYTEVELALSSSYLSKASKSWTMTPHSSGGYKASQVFRAEGGFKTDYPLSEIGVRPAISLRPGIEYISGDGTGDSPYVIDTAS